MNPALEMIAPADVQREADAATTEALAFVESHRIEVSDRDSLIRAVELRLVIAERQQTIANKIAKPKAWAHGLHKWFCALESAALAPYTKLDTYERDQIREFKAAEDRRRAEAERLEAERQRRDAEARAATEAAALETTGDHTLADAVLEEAVSAPAPVVVLPDATKVDGLAFTRRYLWRYAPGGLVRALALLPRPYLTVDEKKITLFAKAMKGTATLPGIEFYHVDDPVRR
jgi:hypothetical protein